MRKIEDYNKWVEKRWNEGYGQGRFKEYKSWFKHTSFSSAGHTSVVRGISVDRDYVFFSDLEKWAFRILDFRDHTIDILEQVPLINRDLSDLIAQELRVKHPKYLNTDTNIIMTLDMMSISLVNGKEEIVCYSVKPSKELENRRIIEKLAIEREYWRREGIPDYRLLTEKDININEARNIESLVLFRDLDNIPNLKNFPPSEQKELVLALKKELEEWPGSPRELSKYFENQYSLVQGTGIPLIKYLLCNKLVKVDLTKPLNFNKHWELL